MVLTGQLPSPPDRKPPTDDPPSDATGQAYIVVHCDPHGEEVCGSPENSQWDQLVEVVASADERAHKLTLLMTADWAECIEADPKRLDALATWLKNGHQLGYHHGRGGKGEQDSHGLQMRAKDLQRVER